VSRIAERSDIFTLIITLEVLPENCDALVDAVSRNARDFMRHQPGFVSTNLHRNADSTRVVNYAQWRSRELYEQARARDGFVELSERVNDLAEGVDPIVCEVVFIEERPAER
jgi:quinol monooxygenase YgiN